MEKKIGKIKKEESKKRKKYLKEVLGKNKRWLKEFGNMKKKRKRKEFWKRKCEK